MPGHNNQHSNAIEIPKQRPSWIQTNIKILIHE